MRTNAEGLRLIEEEEAFIPFVYDDFVEPRSATDTAREFNPENPNFRMLWPDGRPRGTLTIGYGTTGARLRIGARIDRATAEKWLAEDLRQAERDVARLVKVGLNENQFSALVSFVYNVGPEALARSTLLRLLNAGNTDAVPRELNRWVNSKGKRLAGLVRRRAREGALWAKPVPDAVVDDDLLRTSPALVPTEIDPEVPLATVAPDPVPDKTESGSRTLWSTLFGSGGLITAVLAYATDWKVLFVVGVLVIAGAYVLIGRERIQRFVDERMPSHKRPG